MPSVIYLVLFFPFLFVLGGIRPIVFVHLGLVDIFYNLPFSILGLILLRGPMLFLVVVGQMCFFRTLPCIRDSVSALFPSMFFRFDSPLLYPLRSLTWPGSSPLVVLRVERVRVDLFLSLVFCPRSIRMFRFHLPVRLPMTLRSIRLD